MRLNLGHAGKRIIAGQHKFLAVWLGAQHAQRGDNGGWAAADKAMAGAGVAAFQIARRADVVHPFGKALGFMADHDHHPPGAAGNVIGAARAGQPGVWRAVMLAQAILPDAGGVDVAELVHLRRANNPHIATARRHQKAQRIQRMGKAGGVGRQPVAFNAPGQAAHWRGAVHAAFGHRAQSGRVVRLGKIAGQHGQANAKNGQLAVAQLAAGGNRHHFLTGVRQLAHACVSGVCASSAATCSGVLIHWRNGSSKKPVAVADRRARASSPMRAR